MNKVLKRNRKVVDFDAEKITDAIFRAARSVGGDDTNEAKRLTLLTLRELNETFDEDTIPTVEDVQDIVEKVLIKEGHAATAKAYILYRERHAQMRKHRGEVPEKVLQLAEESKQYFENQLAEFVYYRTYSRWIPGENRRETWVETVDRYMDFMRESVGSKLSDTDYADVRENMLRMKTLGSMRLLWAAGPAAISTNVAAYNCSYIAPTCWQDFAEIQYILMCGTGVGFSVEHQTVEQLPIIQRQTGEKLPIHMVVDSKEGWSDAVALGMGTWAGGRDIDFDFSGVRPRGARLNTMGGRSSGPDPLRSLLDFAREKMMKRQGRRLQTIDVHDIICKIGEGIVMGGVRRSALISLSDLDDEKMRTAKDGQFYLTHPERSMANNSAVYNEQPTVPQLLEEWLNLVNSGSGERGIFNRGGLQAQLPTRRWKNFEKQAWSSGTNPCGEIILRSKQFCNLTEVVARANDTEKTLMEKVRVATILGTYQASLTKFPYLSKEWKENCEEEALLGVSITGQWDCPAVRNPSTLRKLKEISIETNREYAAKLGINPSTCITCVKPSGNTSQLTNASSGMHPRHAKYYIRRVRIESHSPIFYMLRDEGVPYHPEVGQDFKNATSFVLEFPVKAPGGSTFKDDLSAVEQLQYWEMVKTNYTEHNPSTTISVGEDEWISVANWLNENWGMIGGLSFLPRSNHVYQLAPYEEITQQRYDEMMKTFPTLDFSKIVLYEYEDTTQGGKELACVSGSCDLESLYPDMVKEPATATVTVTAASSEKEAEKESVITVTNKELKKVAEAREKETVI